MKFKITIIINLIIWALMFIDSIYVMYAKPQYFEIPNIRDGAIFSKFLIAEAIVLFVILLCIERCLFRKSRINKWITESPLKLVIPFYFMTILGTALAQASIIWGNISFSVGSDSIFVYILYGISLTFSIYYFPWSWRLSEKH